MNPHMQQWAKLHGITSNRIKYSFPLRNSLFLITIKCFMLQQCSNMNLT